MLRYLVALVGVCAMGACEVDCQYNQVELTVLENGVELAKVQGDACSDIEPVVTKSPGHIIIPILSISALGDSKDPYTAFEIGEELVTPANSILQEGPHIVEVRDIATLSNNINDPKVKNLVSENQGENYVAQGDVVLSGHELQLMLALENINDPGGAKLWTVGEARFPDGTLIDPNAPGEWSCFLDNRYTFMKGRRMKYDPNMEDNSGSLCDAELDYFTDPSSVTQVYGTYEILQTDDALIVRTSVSTSISEFYVVDFQILEYSWDVIKTEVANFEGEIIEVDLIPSDYPEHNDF